MRACPIHRGLQRLLCIQIIDGGPSPLPLSHPGEGIPRMSHLSPPLHSSVLSALAVLGLGQQLEHRDRVELAMALRDQHPI